MEPRIGLEPMTCGLGDRCSVQLSYRGSCMLTRATEEKGLVEIAGLEPATSALRTPRSPN
jgi:hypothetical protein